MDERTPEKVIEKIIIKEVRWEDWLADERDKFSKWLGVLSTQPSEPHTKDWDEQLILWQKKFLEEIIDSLFKTTRSLKEQNENLRTLLKERDAQITDILDKVQKWMEYYTPLLKKIERQEKQFGKVKRK
jgi:hypothetical protein